MKDRRLHDLLRRYGLDRSCRGYDLLIFMLELARADRSLLDHPVKLLYPDAVKRFGISVTGVDSALRTAARICWQEGLDEACGMAGKPAPTAKDLLRILAEELDRLSPAAVRTDASQDFAQR